MTTSRRPSRSTPRAPALAPLAHTWQWQLRAACRGADPALFFHPDGERDPARAERERAAKAVCTRCPVLRDCASHALRTPEHYGVWGDLSEYDRERMLAHPDRSA